MRNCKSIGGEIKYSVLGKTAVLIKNIGVNEET